MNKPFKLNLIWLFCLFLALPSWAKLTPEQEADKQKGIILFKQPYFYEDTEELLIPAVEAGDVEAMVYLGIVFKVTMPLMAGKYLEKAANQGDIYAMYQLSMDGAIWDQFGFTENKNKTDWKKKGAELSLERAKQGDPESMYIYYKFTGDFAWLQKAADAGWAEAQVAIANEATNNRPPFDKLTAKEREKIVVDYRERAAKQGSLKAMYSLAFYYGSIFEDIPPRDQAKAQAYLLQAVEGSYLPAVETYISALDGYKTYQKHGFEKDPVKAYALTAWMVDVDIGGKYKHNLTYYTEGVHLLDGGYIPPLTPEQIKQGNILKEQWAKTHPPLTSEYNKLSNVN